MGRPKGSLAPTTPRLTERQLDRMVELHDRYGLSYRAIGTRYGVSERMAARMAREWREARDGEPQ